MRMTMFAVLASASAAFSAAFAGFARAETAAPAISGPFIHENLAIYFAHGPSAPGPVPLTLQEAMAKGTVRVDETGSVNELRIENTGEEDVYVQSGDIVKGGRQDRVLQVSFVLPRKSGPVPVAAYCVEHGRWSTRGAENPAQFAGSYNSIPSREAKLAMNAPVPAAPAADGPHGNTRTPNRPAQLYERQQAIWNEVAKMQDRISGGVNEPVAAPASTTSLALSLENAKLEELQAQYRKALEDKAAAGDIVGLVFAVNGRINSADIYPSNGLFRKMWAKLLTASVTEAIGEKNQEQAQPAPSIEAVQNFLRAAESGTASAQEIGNLAHRETRDGSAALFVESVRPGGTWVHRNYLAK